MVEGTRSRLLAYKISKYDDVVDSKLLGLGCGYPTGIRIRKSGSDKFKFYDSGVRIQVWIRVQGFF